MCADCAKGGSWLGITSDCNDGDMSNRIAFLGCGSMNEAILGGLIDGGVDPADIVATVRRAERAAELAQRHHGITAIAGEEEPDNNKQAANEASKSSEPFVDTASVTSLPEDLKLLVRGGTQSTPQKVELPVFEAGNLDPFWLENRPSPMPENVVRQLEQLGHQVKQQRRMIRVNLDDGRQMVVPVDQVEVVPVKWQ